MIKRPVKGKAVDLKQCPTRYKGNCMCEKCVHCGYGKHTAVHGPLYGKSAGSEPYDHEFVPDIKASA